MYSNLTLHYYGNLNKSNSSFYLLFGLYIIFLSLLTDAIPLTCGYLYDIYYNIFIEFILINYIKLIYYYKNYY